MQNHTLAAVPVPTQPTGIYFLHVSGHLLMCLGNKCPIERSDVSDNYKSSDEFEEPKKSKSWEVDIMFMVAGGTVTHQRFCTPVAFTPYLCL